MSEGTTEKPSPASSRSAIAPGSEQAAVAPVIISFDSSRPPITEIMAQAYFQVAQLDGDMVNAMRILEQTRASLLMEQDALETWKLLNEEIALADSVTLRPALITVRTWFERQLFDQQERRLRELFERSPEVGWREWLRTFAEALAYWRLTLCRAMVNFALPFPDQFRAPHDFQRSLRLIMHDRWTETYEFFPFLAQFEFLHPQTRARLLIIPGQIHLYFFPHPEPALALFEQAEKLAPGNGRVIAARGDYSLQQNDLENARALLDQALVASPDEVEPYIYHGDLAERQNNFEDAASWYQQAISKVPGDGLGYMRLLRLYGRPEFIEKHESQFESLVERSLAVDETGEYKTYLDLGDAYIASRRFDAAQAQYQRAIDLEPNRLDGYNWKGFGYLEEGPDQFVKADAAFSKAIAIAAEAYNGYWGMGQLRERQEQWPEAAKWYAEVSERQPELRANMLARIGEMRRKAGQYDVAEKALLEALKLDSSTEKALLELADDYYKALDRPDDALRLFKEIREVQGETFEAAYENRLGNVDYFHQRYEDAVQHYLRALELDENDAIYHSNLAGVYGELRRWSETREQLQRAFEISKDQEEFEAQTAVSHNEEGNFYFAQGLFEKAVLCYTEAEKLLKTSPRFPANRSLAYEQLALQRAQAEAAENSAGNGTDALDLLDRAIVVAQDASRLANGQAEWKDGLPELPNQLDRLQRARRLAGLYGTPILTLIPKDSTINVSVASDLSAHILDADGARLSAEFLEQVSLLRERIQKEHGLLIAPLNFSLIERPDAQSNYQIQVLSEAPAYGLLPLTENDPLEALIQRIELAVIPHLDKLCGHQDAANLLAECGTAECKEMASSAFKLHHLTVRLKQLLGDGESIAGISDICEELNRSLAGLDPALVSPAPQPPVGEFSPGVTLIKLHISTRSTINRTDLAASLSSLPALAFSTFGVILPQTVIVESDTIEQNDFQLQFDNELLPVAAGLADDEMWVAAPVETIRDRFPHARPLGAIQEGSVLKKSDELTDELVGDGAELLGPLNYLGFCAGALIGERLALFLTSDIVEYYLSTLKPEYGALIEVTRFFFTTERLTQCLRKPLQARLSIKNLPQVLEGLLGDIDNLKSPVAASQPQRSLA